MESGIDPGHRVGPGKLDRRTNVNGIQSGLGGPAIYRVKVQGRMPPTWSDRLMGMNITAVDSDDAGMTIIVGRLPDQTALSGVLNALYENSYVVLSVECLEQG